MTRIKIELPEEFRFHCSIPVRITDINYGGHVGNDSLLSILHEARMQYFRSFGYTELEFGGTGLIMAAVQIQFKAEMFYGDTVEAFVTAADFSATGFELFYKLEKKATDAGGNPVSVALAQTSMICYDYDKKKISRLPEAVREKLSRG